VKLPYVGLHRLMKLATYINKIVFVCDDSEKTQRHRSPTNGWQVPVTNEHYSS